MAQRDKKEEPTELRAPEITLCANSCGFPGNPATQNLCQSCFLAASASASAPPSPSASASASPSSSSSSLPVVDKPRPAPVAEAPAELVCPPAVDRSPAATELKATAARASVSRCTRCRKRVGLMGFRCRCGDLFCGEHRYSDRHGCSYDYKAAGRDAIARDNPVVRAAKIVRF